MLSERQIFSKVYMAIAILTSGYALATTQYSPVIYLLCALGAIAYLIRASTPYGRVRKHKSRIALLVLSVFFFPAVLSLVANPSTENTVSLFKLALAMTFGSILFASFEFKEFQRLFANAIYAICLVSIAGYALVNFTDMLPALPVIQNVNNVGYKFALIFITFDGFLQYRNIGVFWEPGIFATMIFCALAADLYSNEAARSVRTTVFLVTLVSTFSGAGLILFAIYIGLLIAKPSEPTSNTLRGRVGPILVIVLIAIFLSLHVAETYPDAYAYLERLIGKLTDPEDTQSTRFLSPLTSLMVFSEKPLLGWGLTSAIEEYNLLNNEIALTSTSAYFISAIGVFGLFFTVIPSIGILRLTSLNLPTRALLLFSFLFIVNKEPHVYFTLTHALIFFLLSASLKQKQTPIQSTREI